FADFVEKADAAAKAGPAPRPPGGGRKAKPDAAAVDLACQRVLDLYNRAIDPSVTLDEINAGVQALEALDPPAARLAELARKMGYTQKSKKADAIKAIRQKIVGRKGAFDRPDA